MSIALTAARLLALAWLTGIASYAAAQTPVPYGPPISLEMAKKAVAAAEAEARKNSWPVVDRGRR